MSTIPNQGAPARASELQRSLAAQWPFAAPTLGSRRKLLPYFLGLGPLVLFSDALQQLSISFGNLRYQLCMQLIRRQKGPTGTMITSPSPNVLHLLLGRPPIQILTPVRRLILGACRVQCRGSRGLLRGLTESSEHPSKHSSTHAWNQKPHTGVM